MIVHIDMSASKRMKLTHTPLATLLLADNAAAAKALIERRAVASTAKESKSTELTNFLGTGCCRAMVEDKEGRVDFGMAEALAFGTLALHRGVRPPSTEPANSRDRPELQPSTVDSQLQQEELIGALQMHHLNMPNLWDLLTRLWLCQWFIWLREALQCESMRRPVSMYC